MMCVVNIEYYFHILLISYVSLMISYSCYKACATNITYLHFLQRVVNIVIQQKLNM